MRSRSAEVLVSLPSLNSSLFHLLEDKLRFSACLRIFFSNQNMYEKIMVEQTDVIKNIFSNAFDNHK